jgi:amino acid adenylation domain-containing protein
MNLFEAFENSLHKYPKSSCLVINDTYYTYADVASLVDRIALALTYSRQPFVGVFSHRSLSAYAGILAALKTGKTFVPLNPKFPIARNQKIINLVYIDTLIIGEKCESKIPELVSQFENLRLIYPESKTSENPTKFKKHTQIFAEQLYNPIAETMAPPTDGFAYMLFTSGSTGTPKGIPITHSNVLSYLNYLTQRYSPTPEDRFSQTFDLTFDLSIHDMFLCWKSGSSLYCIPEKDLMAPAKFINTHQLSMWFSVPSLAQVMSRFRMLKPNAFPHLRYSLFCGEPLHETLAAKWQEAAPNSIVENIYGPTEATIGITHYTWQKNSKQNKTYNGIVSLGHCFSNQKYAIIDEIGKQVEPGKEGELCLSGSQVSAGYWQNPKKTSEQFIHTSFSPNQENTNWYKTGDIVKEDEGKFLYYISRKDFQVKIRGHRIELDEVNNVISKFVQSELVVSVPHPICDGIAENIYTFISAPNKKSYSQIREHCKEHLPDYMIPAKVIYLDSFPLNSNKKIDRQQLLQFL